MVPQMSSAAVAGSSIPGLGAKILADVKKFLEEQNLQFSAREFAEMEMTFKYHEVKDSANQPSYELVTKDSYGSSEAAVQQMKVYLKVKK